MTVFERANIDDPWSASTLTAADTLSLPEIGIDIPVAEFYEAVDWQS